MSTSERTDAPSKATATPQAGPKADTRKGLFTHLMRPEARSRRLLLAGLVYVVCTSAYATLAGSDRLVQHTSFNHYALLADAWLHGRQHTGGPPSPSTPDTSLVLIHGKMYIFSYPFP